MHSKSDIITFVLLTDAHFSLLLKWLNEPHVKSYWDKDVAWTLPLVEKKYSSYVNGYKIENGVQKPIQAYVIYLNNIPIGYIQTYNAYDFLRAKPLAELPLNLAAFDFFIGEKNVLGRGLGLKILNQFFDDNLKNKFTHVFVDPQIGNTPALRTYEKAGFIKIAEHVDVGEIWLIKPKYRPLDLAKP